MRIAATTAQGNAPLQGLVANLQKTQLGRDLMSFIEQNNIQVVIADRLPPGFKGYYQHSNLSLVLSGKLDPAQLLHFFAHETRHAGQFKAEEKIPYKVGYFHPLNLVAVTRLRELDADAFATYFVHNHSRKTGENTFFELRDAQEDSFDRRNLYRAYWDAWIDTNARDQSAAMRATHKALAALPWLYSTYNRLEIENWNNAHLPYLKKVKYAAGSRIAWEFNDMVKIRMSSEKLISNIGKAYGGVFNSFGVPDYFSHYSDGQLMRRITKGVAAELHGDTAIEFNQAANDYAWEFEEIRKNHIVSTHAPRAVGIKINLPRNREY